MDQQRPAMAGDGYYNEHSPQQGAIAVASADALRRAVAALPRTVTASVIADYGCSQGANSIAPIRTILDALAERGAPASSWQVVHTDLPANDWSTLFATVFGPGSYLRPGEAVYPSAIGRSFYEPLLPEGSVAVGWSGTSALWLSGRPEVGPGNVFSPLATGEDHRRWAEAAASDWREFLTLRSRELAPGGRLVITSLQWSDAYPPFLRLIHDAIRSAAAAGAISRSEADAMTVPTYQRTREEIEAPFAEPPSGLDLVIDEHTSFVAPDPAFAAYGDHGDVERFAVDETAQIRGWSGPSLAAALDPDRGPGGLAAAIDAVFDAVRAAVLADPATGHCDWTTSLLTVSRPPAP